MLKRTAKWSEISSNTDLQKYAIAVVIPCHRVEREIAAVIANLPRYLQYIIVVDDASRDKTSENIKELAQKDGRISLICHEKKSGCWVSNALRLSEGS